jgi:hypothetical protein
LVKLAICHLVAFRFVDDRFSVNSSPRACVSRSSDSIENPLFLAKNRLINAGSIADIFAMR